MIDVTLAVTVALMLGVPWLAARRLTPRTLPAADVVGEAMPGLAVGVLMGRLTAMALDDPRGLTRPGDILILRGGVEFWPGVAAGVLVLAWSARGANIDLTARLADLAPFALWAYAAYEAACLVRDGCFGPPSPIGFRPEGTATTLFPVGLAVALSVVDLGAVVRALGRHRPALAVLVAVGGLGAIRAIAAVWLPRVDAGLTRPHRESIAVATAAAVVGAIVLVRRQLTRGGGGDAHYDGASE